MPTWDPPLFSSLLNWCCMAGKLNFIPTASPWSPGLLKTNAWLWGSHRVLWKAPLRVASSLSYWSGHPNTASLHFSQSRGEVNQFYPTAIQWGNQAMHQNHWNVKKIITTMCLTYHLCYKMSWRPGPHQGLKKAQTLDIKSRHCYISSMFSNREYPSACARWVNEQVIHYLVQAFCTSVHTVSPASLKNRVVTAKQFLEELY